MSRRADGTAPLPGAPGCRGTGAREHGTDDCGAAELAPHRPVTDASNRAGAVPAAPSNRGDNLSAADAAPASALAHADPKHNASSALAAPTGAALVLDSQRSVTRPAK